MHWDDIDAQVPALIAQGAWTEAVRVLEHFLARHPQHLPCLRQLASIYRESTLPHAAIHRLHYLKTLQEVAPAHPEFHTEEAQLHEQADDRQAALESAKAALFADNRDAQLWRTYERLAPAPMPPYWPAQLDIAFYTGHPLAGSFPLPAQLDTHGVGGSETVLWCMARALASAGKRVAVFAPFTAPGVADGVYCLPILDFTLWQRYRELPVAIVSRFHHPFDNECRARRRIFWLHDIVTPASRALYQRIDPQVDEYWVLSEYQRALYRDGCGLDDRKIWRTTNAIAPHWGSIRPLLAERTSGHIIYTSRPGRGLALLMRVCDRLRRDFPDLTLTVCCYSSAASLWHDPELRTLRDALRAPHITVTSVGKTALREQLAHSVLMLYPNASELETSCLAAIEAMAVGTPVVTSNRGCLAETVQHGETGLVAAWHDDPEIMTERLANTAARVLRDPTLWEHLSRNAHTHTNQRHAAETVAREWLARLGMIG